ncbi:MAG: hypothetical protein WAV51_03790 [Microgenomates group bacterium]
MAKTAAKKKTESVTSSPSKSKPLPVGIKIAIGCVGILVVIGILIGVAGQVIFSKIGLNFMKKGIEQKTGISMDTEGKSMKIKDDKTGAEINFGTEGKIPADFPKDFPIYPGVKVEGNISGAENNAGKGFWLILSTTDEAAKVTAYYEANLPKNGWEIGSTMNIGTSATWEISKGDMAGGLIVGEDEEKKGASIVITLAPKEETTEE